MKKIICLRSGALLAALSVATGCAIQPHRAHDFDASVLPGDLSAEEFAQKISLSSELVQKNYQTLLEEAHQIQNENLRQIAQQILVRPRFLVVEDRKRNEQTIVRELIAAKLYTPKNATVKLFPTHLPMAFIAAPASFWSLHHSYPGGLVYHTLTNLEIGLAIAKQWERVYQIKPFDEDLLRLAVIWHDSAKTMVVKWNADGSASPDEGEKIANTGAHHIWGIAEAIYRGMSPKFVVILASAHQSAHGKEKSELLNYLRAGAIIAGKPYASAGLNPEGSDLSDPAPLESFIHHLSDHDFVATEVTLPFVRNKLETLMRRDGQANYWTENKIFSDHGDLGLYDLYLRGGDAALESLLH